MKGLTDDIMAAMWAPGLGPETIYRDWNIYGGVSRDSLESRVFCWGLDIVLAVRFGCLFPGWRFIPRSSGVLVVGFWCKWVVCLVGVRCKWECVSFVQFCCLHEGTGTGTMRR